MQRCFVLALFVIGVGGYKIIKNCGLSDAGTSLTGFHMSIAFALTTRKGSKTIKDIV